eukprot:3452534-Pyramimonas_sp.AAC.1
MDCALGGQSIWKDRVLSAVDLQARPPGGCMAVWEGRHEVLMRAAWRRASVAAAQAKPGQSLWRGVKGPASAALATLRRL